MMTRVFLKVVTTRRRCQDHNWLRLLPYSSPYMVQMVTCRGLAIAVGHRLLCRTDTCRLQHPSLRLIRPAHTTVPSSCRRYYRDPRTPCLHRPASQIQPNNRLSQDRGSLQDLKCLYQRRVSLINPKAATPPLTIFQWTSHAPKSALPINKGIQVLMHNLHRVGHRPRGVAACLPALLPKCSRSLLCPRFHKRMHLIQLVMLGLLCPKRHRPRVASSRN